MTVACHSLRRGILKGISVVTASSFIGSSFFAPAAWALPAYARKYQLSCTTCHTVYPQLNAYGHQFRRLGYRLPDEVNKGATSAIQPPSAEDKALHEQLQSSHAPAASTPQSSSAASPDTQVWLEALAKDLKNEIKAELQGQPAASSADTTQTLGKLKEALKQEIVTEVNQQSGAAPEQERRQRYFFADLGDTISMRSRFRYQYVSRADRKTDNEFNLKDVTMFYTGNALEDLSYFFEANLVENGGPSSMEVAQVQYNFGDAEQGAFVRAGQMHMIDRVGFGAIDRPITISTPLIRTTTINKMAFNQNGRGIELGGRWHDTTLLGQVFNGVTSSGDDTPENNSNGRQDENNKKDFTVGLEHLFGDSNSGVSSYWVHGEIPRTSAGDKDTTYNLGSLFANYYYTDWHLNLLAGGMLRRDSVFGTTILRPSEARGFFLEADKRLAKDLYHGDLWTALRYDQIDPSNREGRDAIHGVTASLIFPWKEYTRLALEYTYQDRASTTSQDELNQLMAELQFNF